MTLSAEGIPSPSSQQSETGLTLARGGLLARNAVLNFAAEMASILFGLVSLPFIIRGLGTDSFGVLSLAWVLLVYFGMFDLGLSRATTKLVSEAMGKGEPENVPRIIGTTLTLQFGLGLAAGALIALFVPFLAGRVLRISSPLLPAAEASFYILAAAVPIVLASNSLRGALEALQRFDLVSYVRIPTNALMFLGPLALLPFGVRLRGIVLMMALVRTGAMLAFFACCTRSVSSARNILTFQRNMVNRLMSYGGWITASNVAGPILIYVDRFVIGSMISMSAVAYYAAPSDMVSRLLIIPTSLVATLFPAFSTLGASGDKLRVGELYARALKFVILALGPCLLIVAAFSSDILRLWLGTDFAQKSAVPLQVLALAVFINALAFFPVALLQGLDRPDITAIFHLCEVPIYLGLVWVFVAHMGILGAALAWTARVAIDTLLLFGACFRLRLTSLHSLATREMRHGVALLMLLGAAEFLLSIGGGLGTRAVLGALVLALYCGVCWRLALDERDRRTLTSLLESFNTAMVSVRRSTSKACAVGSDEVIQ